MKLLALLALLGTAAHGQHGMTGLATNPRPRIWWNDAARLASAQAYIIAHPWTPGSNTIDHAGLYAAYCVVTGLPVGDASYCDTARDTVLAFVITHNADSQVVALQTCLSALNAASDCGDDRLRYYGEIVAEVYDWAYSSFSSAQKRLLLDRWLGATVDATDPPHVVTDCAVGAGSTTMTCASGPFLANMAANNMAVVATGGTNCNSSPTGETNFAIASVTNSTTATITANFNTSASTGCHISFRGYVSITEQNSWGAADMPYSNYNRGFTRNNFMWAITAYGDSAWASSTLDNWETRWTTNLAYQAGTSPYTANSSLGGLFAEGQEYGLESALYQVMPLFVAADYGRNLVSESNWYREFLAFFIYNNTLKPTSDQNGTTYPQQFPWDDFQKYTGENTPEVVQGYPSGILGQAVVSPLAQLFGTTNLSKYSRQFVNAISGSGIMPIPWMADSASSTLALTGLPLDYYAPGTGAGMTKDTWSASGTQVKFLPTNDLSVHTQMYQGEFQIASNGLWMTKGFTSYSDSADASKVSCLFTGTTTPGVQGTSACDVKYPPAHNTVSFVPSTATGCNVYPWTDSQANRFYSASPATLALESKANYYFQANNLTGGFYNGELFDTARMCTRNNPYADTWVREGLFIKPLKALIILDRAKSTYNPQSGDTHPSQTASQLTKTIYIHGMVAPTISGNTVTWDNDTERMQGKFFTNESAISCADVDESDFPGHVTGSNYYYHRLECGAGGHAQSYIVSVLKMGPVSGFNSFTTATLTGTGPYTLTLASADGNATFIFGDGSTPTGESFGYAASGTPSTSALATTVNPPTVDNNGVNWPGGGTNGGLIIGGKAVRGGK